MIRRCDERDFELIWSIINDGAHAYEGVIPAECWREPYMSGDELHAEMEDGVTFWGYEENEALTGVMGIQQVEDVTLVATPMSAPTARTEASAGAFYPIYGSWPTAPC